MITQEQVLVLPAQCVERVFSSGSQPLIHHCGALHNPANFHWMDRAHAELDPNWKQVIPYVVLHHKKRVLSYNRGKGSGEFRLLTKRSIGFGGHITPVDGDLNAPEIIMNAIQRELNEELMFDVPIEHYQSFGYIYDPSNFVGQVHIGFIFTAEVPSDKIASREVQIKNPTWDNVSSLIERKEEFESWSQILIEHLSNHFHSLQASQYAANLRSFVN